MVNQRFAHVAREDHAFQVTVPPGVQPGPSSILSGWPYLFMAVASRDWRSTNDYYWHSV